MSDYELGKDVAEIKRRLENIEKTLNRNNTPEKVHACTVETSFPVRDVYGSLQISLTENTLDAQGKRLLSPSGRFILEFNNHGQLHVVSGPAAPRPGEVVWMWGHVITLEPQNTAMNISIAVGVTLSIQHPSTSSQRWLTFLNGVPNRLDLWDDSSLHIYDYRGQLLFNFNYGVGLPPGGWTVLNPDAAVPT